MGSPSVPAAMPTRQHRGRSGRDGHRAREPVRVAVEAVFARSVELDADRTAGRSLEETIVGDRGVVPFRRELEDLADGDRDLVGVPRVAIRYFDRIGRQLRARAVD